MNFARGYVDIFKIYPSGIKWENEISNNKEFKLAKQTLSYLMMYYLYFFYSRFLALITQPFSSLLATFIQVRSTKLLMLILLITVFIASYILVVSCMSPCPPLKDHWAGGYIMVRILSFKYNTYQYYDCYFFLRCRLGSSLMLSSCIYDVV